MRLREGEHEDGDEQEEERSDRRRAPVGRRRRERHRRHQARGPEPDLGASFRHELHRPVVSSVRASKWKTPAPVDLATPTEIAASSLSRWIASEMRARIFDRRLMAHGSAAGQRGCARFHPETTKRGATPKRDASDARRRSPSRARGRRLPVRPACTTSRRWPPAATRIPQMGGAEQGRRPYRRTTCTSPARAFSTFVATGCARARLSITFNGIEKPEARRP